MSPILVTLTSRSDYNFERSNISLKGNKRDGVDLNSNGLYITAFERTKEDSMVFCRLLCSRLNNYIAWEFSVLNDSI